MNKKPRLCCDFDGVIWDGNNIIDGCVEKLRELRQKYSIAIFSARATEDERKHMERLLDYWCVPYDEILPLKPVAIYYLDDKGVKFESWNKVDL